MGLATYMRAPKTFDLVTYFEAKPRCTPIDANLWVQPISQAIYGPNASYLQQWSSLL